jgi:hypothetical protein
MVRLIFIGVLVLVACGRSDEPAMERMQAPAGSDDGSNPEMTPLEPAAESCDLVGPRGRCSDGALMRCDSGTTATVTACETGQVCAYKNDASGYACVDASIVGAFVASGIAEYEDRPIQPGKLEAVRLLPIRGASAYVVRNSDNKVLGQAVTSDDGSFVIHYDAPAGTLVRISIATSSPNTVRPAKVKKNSGSVHGLGSPAFEAQAEMTKELLATEKSELGHAFNVFDMLVEGLDQTRAYGATNLTPIEAKYQRNSNSGSFFVSGPPRMTIAGGPDDDGYDDMVILHEFGHYHQSEYGATDNPGGSHPNPGGDDPRLAWAEGQATYLANAFLGVPYYIDTNYQDGGWFVELEKKIHKAKPQGSMSQFILEWMVAELLWDVGDEALVDADGDGVVGTHMDAIGVTQSYFHDPAYKNRGFGGVDLVEWLDGWFWLTGVESCSEMKALMTKYGFPYDFKGPVACP